MTAVFLGLGVVGLILLVLSLIKPEFFARTPLSIIDARFGPAAAFGFLTVFGFVAAGLGWVIHWHLFGSIVGAFFAGLLGGAFVGALMRYMQESAPLPVLDSSLIGQKGKVIIYIPAGGYGEVEYDSGNEIIEISATSNDPIPEGTEVEIILVAGSDTVKVTQVSDKETLDPPN